MDPYLKPSWGLGYALKIETRYSWEPNQPGNVVTGILYNNFDTSTDTLYPKCEWTVPLSENYEVIAAFPLYETEHSPAIKYYVCYEARFLDFTASSYHLMTKWTIRTPDTRAWYADLTSPLETIYSIPGTSQSLTTPELYFNWEFFNQVLYIGLTIQCMGSYDYGGQTYLYNLPVGLALCPSLIDTRYGYFDSDRAVTPIEDPNELDPGGPSSPGGGDGNHDQDQDPVPYPEDPPIGGASGGFITLYRMTVGEITRFAKKMYEFNIIQALKDLFADPMDMICGVMIMPFKPDTSGTARPVVHTIAADITWVDYYNVITDQYQDIDCGSMVVEKYFGSAFDYNPFTRLLLFLPYIGYKELDPDEVMGSSIQVKYKVDCMTGDCVAFVIRLTGNGLTPVRQVIAQYSGNCGVRVAFGRASFDAAIQASVQLITGLVSGVARGVGGMFQAAAGMGGNVGAETEGQMLNSVVQAGGTVAASMPSVEQMKTQMVKSGLMGANAGFISVQKPHLIRIFPNQSLPDNYQKLSGYPSNIAGPIASGGFRGYMEIEKIELDGLVATAAEKFEIETMLKGGVLYGHA